MLVVILMLVASIFFVFALLMAIRETVQNGDKNVYYGFVAAISLFALALLSSGFVYL